ENDYLLADAAYTLSETVPPRYRNGLNNADDPAQATFNIIHGSARVVIKNAFGVLKFKFQSLQNLPAVNHLRDMDKVASWIMT
ncbi:hypothetical protein EC957_000998, partial [Mortierella hygrophila]